jgi:AraC-like DNA-binding protein
MRPCAVYAELAPLPRHEPIVDHVFVLYDRGVLTALDRSLFASPFSEIHFFRSHDGSAGDATWQTRVLKPRTGATPRRHALHGFMLGIRFSGAGSAAPFARRGEPGGVGPIGFEPPREGAFLDAAVAALDAVIDSACMSAAPLARMDRAKTAAAIDDASVGALAGRLRLPRRSLQRHILADIGLAPKAWLALQRFRRATHRIAQADASLVDVALSLGYADQAHLSADFRRRAAVSPARFRAKARHQVAPEAGRFFQDADNRRRLRLLVSETMPNEAERELQT